MAISVRSLAAKALLFWIDVAGQLTVCLRQALHGRVTRLPELGRVARVSRALRRAQYRPTPSAQWRGLANVPDAILAVAYCGALVITTDFGPDETNVNRIGRRLSGTCHEQQPRFP